MAAKRPTLNLVERAIAEVAPKWAFRRLQAKTALALAGGYSGASRNRHSLRDWTPQPADAVSDTNPDLPDLRARSRDLARNSMLGHGAIGSVVDHAIGTGLTYQSRIDAAVLGLDEDAAAAWQDNTERRFHFYAKSVNCDITRQQDLYKQQRMVLQSMLESGDLLALMVNVIIPGWPYSLAVQTVEADRICNPDFAQDTDTRIAGIDFNAAGAAVTYHIAKFHPGNVRMRGKQTWASVAAFGARSGRRNAIHIFERTRPGQVRGVPFLAPVIEALKQISRYTEAELQAAVVNAVFAVFMKMDATAFEDLFDDKAQGAYLESASGWNGKIDGNGIDNGGKVVNLMPGEEPVTVTPGRPNPAFDPFFNAIASQIGTALGIPFEVLIKHFTSSYTAARAALLDAWRFFMKKRHWLADNFCQPIYEAWLADEVALGRISAPGFFADPFRRAAYCGSQWVGDAPGSVDPLKEALATEKNLALRRTTLAKETMAYDGSDWEDNHEQIVNEARRAREDGFLPVGAQPAAPPAPPPDDREDDDNTDPEDNDQADPRQAMAAVLAALTTAAADRKQGDVHVNVALPETLQHQLVERLEIAGLEEIAGALKSISRDNAHQMAAFISNLRAEFQHLADAQQNLADQPLQFEYDAAGNPLRAVPVKNR